jgi:hypothetical protein
MIVANEETGEVRKTGQSSEERRRIEREVAILRAVAHPGVVEVVTTEGDLVDSLVLRRVEGGSLDELRGPVVEVLAGIGAAIATTVADLHDIGFVHRAISADHVLLDLEGRPVLCGFGRALGPLSPSEIVGHRAEDVQALATLLLERTPAGDCRLRSLLRAAELGRRRSRRGDARWLARRLVEVVPAARLESGRVAPQTEPGRPVRVWPEDAEPSSEHEAFNSAPGDEAPAVDSGRRADRSASPHLWHRRPATLAAGGLVAGTAVAALMATVVPGLVGSGAAPSGCPAADRGCGPLELAGGVITTGGQRFQLVGSGSRSIVVLGRWECTAQALPAELDVGSGDVWIFDRWPGPGDHQSARLAGRIPSASGLSVRPGRAECDLLEVQREDRPPATINPSLGGRGS